MTWRRLCVRRVGRHAFRRSCPQVGGRSGTRVGWVGGRTRDEVGVLFTPWGEALVRRWYQDALATLTGRPHLSKAAIQTNLSGKLDWVGRCDRSKLALWCTFHPTETTRGRFLTRCRELAAATVRFSVGVVGLKGHFAAVAALRAELPPTVYLWVNAYKRLPDDYTPEMIVELTRVDPLFPVNNRVHASRGQRCRTGRRVIPWTATGPSAAATSSTGRLATSTTRTSTRASPSGRARTTRAAATYRYVHPEPLGLARRFGSGVLERIPVEYHHPALPSEEPADADVSVP